MVFDFGGVVQFVVLVFMIGIGFLQEIVIGFVVDFFQQGLYGWFD